MNDHDRLAADLAANMVVGPPPAALADRLIALGWTRLVGTDRLFEWDCPECSTRITTLVRIDIDEERLADAIFLAHLDVMRTDTREWLNSDEAAAAIAKAYREDGDA